jgi:hypothetical protein
MRRNERGVVGSIDVSSLAGRTEKPKIGANTILRQYQGSGPFMFCDYWASVLGLKNIISQRLLGSGLASLEAYKRGLDRPKAKLPKFRYYLLGFILGPGMIPYKVAIDLAVLLRSKGRAKEVSRADAVLERFKLRMQPDSADDKWVHVRAGGEKVDGKILNPTRVSVATSLFYPTYKPIIAAALVLSLSAAVIYLLPEIRVPRLDVSLFGTLSYGVLFALLLLLFRDLSTAVLAPLPVFALIYLSRISMDPGVFALRVLAIAVVFYLVDIFFIPRPMPPALFLYVNDPSDPHYPYEKGHAPYWLEGRYYWVWRFVTLAPAEIHKFWEKDWERVEVWVRADEGESAGQIEWLVADVHYRELWFDYIRWTGEKGAIKQRKQLDDLLRSGENEITWVVELGMDLLFHSPFLRGIFLSKRRNGRITGTFPRLLRAAWARRTKDSFKRLRDKLEELELDSHDFLQDVPEHFRNIAFRQLLSLPWTYWRYPLGAGSSLKVKAYDPQSALVAAQHPAADPQYQLKDLSAKRRPA